MSRITVNAAFAVALVLAIGTYLVAQNPPPNQAPPPNNPAPNNPNYTPPPANNPPGTNPPHYNPPAGNNPNAQPQQQMVARHVKQVIGSNVTISGGTGVGTVEDIIFNDNGCIDYVVVVQNGKYNVMPYNAIQFNWDQRVATVNITQDKYQAIPTYTQQQLPTVQYYEPTFVTRTYGYYGIEPTRRDIRIDRREDRRERR